MDTETGPSLCLATFIQQIPTKHFSMPEFQVAGGYGGELQNPQDLLMLRPQT